MRTDHRSNARNAVLVIVLAAIAAQPAGAAAQVDSNIATATLQGSLAESLTVSVTGGSTVNFTLLAGQSNDGDVPVTISTSWTVSGLVGTVSLYAYFNTPSAALTDGSGNDIPSSAVLGRMLTGAPLLYTAFTQTNALGPAGGGLKLFDEIILLLNRNRTRSDDLDLRVNLGSLGSLPAGTYSGTLRIQARAL